MTPEEFLEYRQDVKEAQVAFPGMEMRKAYERFMVEVKKKEPRPLLNTKDESLKSARRAVLKILKRPCTQPGCTGTQELSGVCGGCAAAKKGFKTQWECGECLYREFHTKEYLEWFKDAKNTED